MHNHNEQINDLEGIMLHSYVRCCGLADRPSAFRQSFRQCIVLRVEIFKCFALPHLKNYWLIVWCSVLTQCSRVLLPHASNITCWLTVFCSCFANPLLTLALFFCLTSCSSSASFHCRASFNRISIPDSSSDLSSRQLLRGRRYGIQ